MVLILLTFVGILTCFGLCFRAIHARELRNRIESTPIVLDIKISEKRPVECITASLIEKLENVGSGRTMCAICFEDFSLSERVVILACTHVYHERCFELYVATLPSSRLLRCPECQRTVE